MARRRIQIGYQCHASHDSGSTGPDERSQAPARFRPGDADARSAAFVFRQGWLVDAFRSDTNATLLTIPAQLDLTNEVRLQLDFDLATLMRAPRPLSFGKDGSSTHSDRIPMPRFSRFRLNWT